MRGSAPRTPEYRTNLNALPLIGSIRLVRLSGVSFWPVTEKENELPPEYAGASDELQGVRIPRPEQTCALC
jgi:hypothetical protein